MKNLLNPYLSEPNNYALFFCLVRPQSGRYGHFSQASPNSQILKAPNRNVIPLCTFSETSQRRLTAHNSDKTRDGNSMSRQNPKMVTVSESVIRPQYVFNFIAEELTAGRKPGSPPTKISQDTLNRAKCFVDYTETHKEIAMETGKLQFSSVQYLARPVFSTTFLT